MTASDAVPGGHDDLRDAMAKAMVALNRQHVVTWKQLAAALMPLVEAYAAREAAEARDAALAPIEALIDGFSPRLSAVTERIRIAIGDPGALARIRAQTLRRIAAEPVSYVFRGNGPEQRGTPRDIADWLRERADAIERGDT